MPFPLTLGLDLDPTPATSGDPKKTLIFVGSLPAALGRFILYIEKE